MKLKLTTKEVAAALRRAAKAYEEGASEALEDRDLGGYTANVGAYRALNWLVDAFLRDDWVKMNVVQRRTKKK